MRHEFYEVYENLYRDYLYDSTHYQEYRDNILYRLRRRARALPPELVKEMVYETQRAIDNAAEKRGDYKVRPDAKYFLLVNFYEMVLRPIATELQTRGEVGERFSRDSMREDLRHDVELILEDAEDRARRRNEGVPQPWAQSAEEGAREISGRNVIDAIGGVWEKIKYNEYLYWGRKDE